MINYRQKWINCEVLKFMAEEVRTCKLGDLLCYYSSRGRKSANVETNLYICILPAICGVWGGVVVKALRY